jgi:hypothetical protein
MTGNNRRVHLGVIPHARMKTNTTMRFRPRLKRVVRTTASGITSRPWRKAERGALHCWRLLWCRRAPLGDVESRIVWLLGGPRTESTSLLELLFYQLTADADAASGTAMRTAETALRPAAIPISEPSLGVHVAPVVTVHPAGVFTAADVREKDPSYFFDDRYAEMWRPQLRRLIFKRIAAQPRSHAASSASIAR